MNSQLMKSLLDAAETAMPVSREVALEILKCSSQDMGSLFYTANMVRLKHFGNKVSLCSVLNAKSGGCAEDCIFCAQSSRYKTHAQIVPLISKQEIVAARETAVELPIAHFGVVTSGKALKDELVSHVCEAMSEASESPTAWCASLGCLTPDHFKQLKAAGLRRFHHNLEAAASFFPNICTTHTYKDRLTTVRAAKQAGLEVCCGGILGMGESLDQRVQLAFELANEQVDSIPLNFLIPIPGTPLGDRDAMTPLDILRCIAMFRMVNPKAEIRVCAGRIHLRDLQSMLFFAGATGIMIGALLTVAGRKVDDDLHMLKDLEVELCSTRSG